jgi:hypothetical protein
MLKCDEKEDGDIMNATDVELYDMNVMAAESSIG